MWKPCGSLFGVRLTWASFCHTSLPCIPFVFDRRSQATLAPSYPPVEEQSEVTVQHADPVLVRSPEEEQAYLELKAIACKTSLESPRLFTPFEVGAPLWGTLEPIRKREHVYVPQPWVADPIMEERTHKVRSSTNTMAFLYKEHDKTLRGLTQWIQEKMLARRRRVQSYDAERVRVLGPELAAAHVFILSGARVKFVGVDRWYSLQDEKLVPGRFVEAARIEAIDAAGSEILYEGLEHLIGCRYLKSLVLKNCKDMDDFCLPKLYILANTLEYLDLSGCYKITERGLACLYHLTRLKTLVIDDLPKAENKELTALLLEDELPACEVFGVEYNPVALPSPVEEREKQEKLWVKERIPLYHRIAAPGMVEVGNTAYAERMAKAREEERKERRKQIRRGGFKGQGID